jgi:hypothetical protein
MSTTCRTSRRTRQATSSGWARTTTTKPLSPRPLRRMHVECPWSKFRTHPFGDARRQSIGEHPSGFRAFTRGCPRVA